MKKLNENQKVTLTVGQIKQLLKEYHAGTYDMTDSGEGNDDFEIKDGVLVKYHGKGGDVVIPNGVTKIGISAFSYKSGITSVTIPDSVTSIGAHSFSNSLKLKTVTIGNNVKSIERRAFACCMKLKSIVIPDSVTTIEEQAFTLCDSLESVVIGSGVTEIGEDAFYGCSGITDVKLSNPKLVGAFANTAWAKNNMNGGSGHNNIYFKLGNGKKFSLVGVKVNWRAPSEWSNIADAVCRYFRIDRKEYAKIIKCIQNDNYYRISDNIHCEEAKTYDEVGNIYDYVLLRNGPSRSWYIYFDERAESCIGETTSLKMLIKANGFRLPSAFKFSEINNTFEYSRNTNYGSAAGEFVRKCADELEKAGWTEIDKSFGGVPDGSSSSESRTLISPDGKVKFEYGSYWSFMSLTDYATFSLNDDKKSVVSENTKVTLTIGQLKKLIKESFK